MMEAMWPCPWKAVWSSCIASEEDEEGSEEMFEVLVSVRKIYLDKEYAKVHLVRPFTCTNPKMTQCEFYTWLRMDMMNVVPLYEIYPIKDEGLNYLEPIAKAIDSARFFYQYLWRFWDSEEPDDYEWISRHLERRLRLYYDIQEGKVPDASNFKKCFETMVIEANEKHSELVDLYSAVSMSDSDTDLNTTDQELTQCADDLKVLRDKLEMMEDPVLRLQVLGTVEDTDK
ncbi:SHC SH2 domain-binding protein 1-like [Lingula anatina]|uniref:SHC SH2 domain-binding protein 1-like n=1 Tax=Lingula anatina TaxID=7574 RepID=A0A1S3KBP3_LINAN|nr:SHC SH2 domain-binding protein 1-like [Lingula anatina]|eukprot:XP_013420050.1 SHC SH2 domain-binding protein 1-like [Lingula anatina]